MGGGKRLARVLGAIGSKFSVNSRMVKGKPDRSRRSFMSEGCLEVDHYSRQLGGYNLPAGTIYRYSMCARMITHLQYTKPLNANDEGAARDADLPERGSGGKERLLEKDEDRISSGFNEFFRVERTRSSPHCSWESTRLLTKSKAGCQFRRIRSSAILM